MRQPQLNGLDFSVRRRAEWEVKKRQDRQNGELLRAQ